MSEFVKNGTRIINKPLGCDYDLTAGKVYNLKYDTYQELSYLEEDGSLNLPDKIYSTSEETLFKQRVLNYFNNTHKNTTGVMLAGLKGSGKTMMSKVIAKESNLPIIVVSTEYRAKKLNDFFTKFKQPVCIIFDEIEKNTYYWPSEQLLTFLDGVQTTAKKLVIFTCNDDDEISEYVKDRCSRIRYYREFKQMSKEMIIEILTDRLKDKSKINTIADFINDNFKTVSYDNIISFIDEYELCNTEDLNYLMKDMNIKKK